MRVSIIASGMGQCGTLTREAQERLACAELIIGAKRIIAEYDSLKAEKIAAVAAEQIVNCIKDAMAEEIVVAMSGDTGFYSGTKSLLMQLDTFIQEGNQVEVIPGVSSVQYMASRIMRPWQDVKLASAHGKFCNVVGTVLSNRETFFLTGGVLTVKVILEKLFEVGLGNAEVYVGERLSYSDERVTHGKVLELVNQTFDKLAVMWVVRDEIFIDRNSTIRDDDFIRGKVPMTKGEVRSVVCDYFNVKDNDIIYDIGAGTGSVAIKLALKYPMATVKAIEVNEDAIDLIHQNRENLQAYNMSVFHGEASELLAEFEAPNHVFIGGSKGNLEQILDTILAINPDASVLISAVTMETVVEATNLCKKYFGCDIEITQISVSRTKAIGRYNMLKAESPIFLIGRRKVQTCLILD
ncbi:MAG: precorrin-6y C5,15-methyltransferase (decarboxylating) subunit CbiE [Lachnospiraceae bacterium]